MLRKCIVRAVGQVMYFSDPLQRRVEPDEWADHAARAAAGFRAMLTGRTRGVRQLILRLPCKAKDVFRFF